MAESERPRRDRRRQRPGRSADLRQDRDAPRQTQLVGEPGAVRLDRAGAAYQGSGPADGSRRAGVPHARRGADDRRRAAAQPGPDGKGRVGSTAATNGWCSPPPTPCVRSRRGSASSDSTAGRLPACGSPAWAKPLPTGYARSGSAPNWCRPASSPRWACSMIRPTTTFSTPGAVARGPTSRPRHGEGLRDRGWEIEDVTAYRTVRAAPPPAHTREMIKTGGFDAVCFTSSSDLVGIAGKPTPRSLIAPRPPKPQRNFGLRVDVQPETAAVGPLVEALLPNTPPGPRVRCRRRARRVEGANP